MNKNPIPNKITEEAWHSLFLHYIHIPNSGFHPDYIRKRSGLISLGISEKEAEELCRPKAINIKEVERRMMEEQEKELRRLANWSRERRKAEKGNESNAIYNNQIHFAIVEDGGCLDVKLIDSVDQSVL